MPLDDGEFDAAVFYNREFLPTIWGGPPVPVREKPVLEPQMSRDEQILLGPIKGCQPPRRCWRTAGGDAAFYEVVTVCGQGNYAVLKSSKILISAHPPWI